MREERLHSWANSPVTASDMLTYMCVISVGTRASAVLNSAGQCYIIPAAHTVHSRMAVTYSPASRAGTVNEYSSNCLKGELT